MSILHRALNMLEAVGNVLDLPSSSVRDALAGKNPLDQWATPLSDVNRTSGRDLLRHYGAAGHEDTWGNYLGGMATEAVLDPLNLIPGLGAAKHVGKVKAIGRLNKGIDAANAVSMGQRAMGFMPEEIAKQTVWKSGLGHPQPMYHGTNNTFDRIDPAKWNDDSLFGPGHYTTADPGVASSYTGKDSAIRIVRKPGVSDHDLMNAYAASRHVYNGLQSAATSIVARQSENGLGITPDLAKVLAPRVDEAAMAAPYTRKPPWLRNAFDNEHRANFLMKHYDEILPSPQVHQSYLDLRNPFDMDEKLGKDRADQVLQQLQKMYNGVGGDADDIADARHYINEIMRGQDAWDYAKSVGIKPRKLLESLGHDSITHIGGKRVGNGPEHQVAIAFSPSQVYKPYIAKALQEHVQPPQYKLPKKLLAAHHATARTRRKNMIESGGKP